MHDEIELKFQVPAAARAAVQAAVAAGSGIRTRLQAAYYDTPDRRLAQAGLALRVRKEGRRWVQTLKGAGEHAMQRLEHNVELAARQRPTADPQRHAGTPAGTRLLAVLAGDETPALQELYSTDIVRTHRRLRTRRGTVELAFDLGEIRAGERRLPVCELEIELQSGHPSVVIELGRRWVSQHGLWLDVRSKAERGDRLARGQDAAEPVKAQALPLHKGATVFEGWRAVLRSSLAQVLGNASELAGGTGTVEHLHQLRVGLRRLRSGLRFFDGWGVLADAVLVEQVTQLFRTLSTTRDRDVQEALAPVLQAAGAPELLPRPEAAGLEPQQLLREPQATLTLLGLLDWLVSAAEPAASEAPRAGGMAERLRPLAARRLKRWHRQAAEAARSFDTLDDTARHRLRKRVKRLRYAIEFMAPLFAAKRVERYLKRLRPAQEGLGLFNDVVVATAMYRERLEQDPRAWFAIGWLAAQREATLAACRSSLSELPEAPKFWK